MKKYLTLFLLSAVLFTFSGCYDYVDIEEKAMIAGFSVDIQDGRYLVCAEILASPSTGSEAEIIPKYITGEGNTIFDACQMIYNISSKEIDFGHCKVIFLSKAFAQKGLEPLIDLVFHERQIKVSIDLVVVDGDGPASDIYKTEPPLNSVISYDVSKTIELNQKNMSSVPRGETYKCLNRIEKIGVEAALPAIRVTEDTYELSGLAYFLNDKLKGYIPASESIFYSILTGESQKSVIPLNVETIVEGQVHTCRISPEIRNLKLSTKLTGEGDEMVLTYNLKINLLLNEVTKELPIENKENRKNTEMILAKELEESLVQFISKVQKEYGCDIIAMGNTIYHKKPQLRQMIAENWEEEFPNFPFKVNVSVDIKSSGTSKYSIQCE